MRNRLLICLIFSVCLSSTLYSQVIRRDTILTGNTIIVERKISYGDSLNINESMVLIERSPKIVRLKWGIRTEAGITKYYYDEATRDWLGNYIGPQFKVSLFYENINFSANFKPWTTSPERDITINNQVLTPLAKLNPIQLESTLGYSLNIHRNYSIEPYIGYLQSQFRVINEDELGTRYSIPSQNGFVAGAALNKYFEIAPFQFIALALNTSYSYSDYIIINPELGKSFFNISLTVAYKAWFDKIIFE